MKRVKNFQFISIISQGQLGNIYLAENISTKEKVAINQINNQNIKDSNLQKALQLEMNIFKQIQAKNIVQCKDYFVTANNFYIVLEYCNSQDLQLLLFKQKTLSEDIVKNYFIQILTGFYELTQRGIIHGDLNPSKIMIHQENGQNILKICQSKCKEIFFSNYMNTYVGCSLYDSPQKFTNQKYSSKCDVWSLGIIIFEMIVGNTPWIGSNPIQLQKIIKQTPLIFPQNIDISDQLKNLLKKMLEIEEVKRFSFDDILRHDYFEDYFIKINLRKEDKTKYIINKIRLNAIIKQQSLIECIQNCDIQQGEHISFEKYILNLKYLDQNIQINEVTALFNKISQNQNFVQDIQQIEKYFILNNMFRSQFLVGKGSPLKMMKFKEGEMKQDSYKKHSSMIIENNELSSISHFKYQIKKLINEGGINLNDYLEWKSEAISFEVKFEIRRNLIGLLNNQ